MNIEERETWKPVKDYEGHYEINRAGNIRSLRERYFHKIIITKLDRAGYFRVNLYKLGTKSTTMYVHRLLAKTFIDNPDNKPFINHKDGNKQNNSLENLEWVSHSENMLHAYRNKLIKQNTRKVIDKCLGNSFNSVKEASEHYKINYNTLRNYLNGWNNNPTCLTYAA